MTSRDAIQAQAAIDPGHRGTGLLAIDEYLAKFRDRKLSAVLANAAGGPEGGQV